MLEMTCMKLSDICIDMSSVAFPCYQRLRSTRHAHGNAGQNIKLTMPQQVYSRCRDRDKRKPTLTCSFPSPPLSSPPPSLPHPPPVSAYSILEEVSDANSIDSYRVVLLYTEI